MHLSKGKQVLTRGHQVTATNTSKAHPEHPDRDREWGFGQHFLASSSHSVWMKVQVLPQGPQVLSESLRLVLHRSKIDSLSQPCCPLCGLQGTSIS